MTFVRVFLFYSVSALLWVQIKCGLHLQGDCVDVTTEAVLPNQASSMLQKHVHQMKLDVLHAQTVPGPMECSSLEQVCYIALPNGATTRGSCTTRFLPNGASVDICSTSPVNSCSSNGQACTWAGFAGVCEVNFCNVWSTDTSCPASCHSPTCVEGASWNGGSSLTDGKCNYHCSKPFSGVRYCGSGSRYTSGDSVDCSGCTTSPKTTTTTTHLACPTACQQPVCVKGANWNGGSLLTDGKCHYHCSKLFSGVRYCGSGSEYTSGDSVDCSGCTTSPKTTTITTATTTAAASKPAVSYPSQLECNAYVQVCYVGLPNGATTKGSCQERFMPNGASIGICSTSPETSCLPESIGQKCTWAGFDGTCAYDQYKGGACNVWSTHTACPTSCQNPACVEGANWNGGSPLTDGRCHYHCSKPFSLVRYCGSGSQYTSGDSVDCSGCTTTPKTTATTTTAASKPAVPYPNQLNCDSYSVGQVCHVSLPNGATTKGTCEARFLPNGATHGICSTSPENYCSPESVSQACTWAGFDGTCAYDQYKGGACNVWLADISCPTACQKPVCVKGSKYNSGVSLTDGKCHYHCSNPLAGVRYCGSGSEYTSGVDCSRCATGEYVHAAEQSSACPTGYHAVNDAESCKAGILIAGSQYAWSGRSDCNWDWPRAGCFSYGQKLYFSTCEGNRPLSQSSHNGICKKGSAPPTTTTTTTTRACPIACEAPLCVVGGSYNGGLPLSNGKCLYHCSKPFSGKRYCGSGEVYTSGNSLNCGVCATGEYLHAAEGSSSCPSGYEAVTGVQQCQAGVSIVGVQYTWSGHSDCSWKWPRAGCFSYGTKLYFSTCGADRPRSQQGHLGICKKTTR